MTPVGGWAEHVGNPFWQAWGHLLFSVRTGENAFKSLNGIDVWEYRAKNPRRRRYLQSSHDPHVAGAALKRCLPPTISPASATSSTSAVASGSLLAAVLRAVPQARGTLFDQPHVVASARTIYKNTA